MSDIKKVIRQEYLKSSAENRKNIKKPKSEFEELNNNEE